MDKEQFEKLITAIETVSKHLHNITMVISCAQDIDDNQTGFDDEDSKQPITYLDGTPI